MSVHPPTAQASGDELAGGDAPGGEREARARRANVSQPKRSAGAAWQVRRFTQTQPWRSARRRRAALGGSDPGRKGLCLVEGQPQAMITDRRLASPAGTR
jgi:hypothetical protein